MNIKQAAEKTGLTKKAIKHYESEGLITVKKNPENHYREFNSEDISKLRLIGALRLLNLSVNEIKTLLLEEQDLPTLLKIQLNKINEDIDKLNKKKSLTTTLLNNLNEIEDFSEVVQTLDDTLNLKEIEKQQYLNEQLNRIFPGVFGEFVSTTFDPFLEISIKTEAEQKTWLEMVRALDDMKEIPLTHPLAQLLSTKAEKEIQNYKRQNKDYIFQILNRNEEVMKQQKDSMVALINQLENSEKFKKEYMEKAKLMKDVPSFKHESEISKLLCQLSTKYKKFLEIQFEIKEAVDKEIGFDSEEYFKKLNSSI
ncbi:MerR family transcriptional regulator [Priestia megaterium]|uniref:MerR family transcriptional regulator n=1 Tax=Priestia megaterium TaxID=1404 RepID=UPI002877C77D|nr:MerR family transcriptional regulator [Priestia megaterium]MBX4163800.1 MerR family transcriptional regulator [Priestia megaterium]